MSTCPHCGQAMPKDYSDVALKFGLSWTQREIFEAVAKANGRMVTFGHLIDLLWGMDPDGGPIDPIATIRVQVLYTNRRLKFSGLKVANIWGQGYCLRKVAANEVAA